MSLQFFVFITNDNEESSSDKMNVLAYSFQYRFAFRMLNN